tara:strand:+ start:279 stop:974 length:696 start_codon:yes stop_codon:yes gene_type:complete
MASFESGESLKRIEMLKEKKTIDSTDKEIIILVMSGDIKIGDLMLTRKCVFSDNPDGIVIANSGKITLESLGYSEICVVQTKSKNILPILQFRKETFLSQMVGKNNFLRSVTQIAGKEIGLKSIIVGETIKEKGNWSSWPPHKHDKNENNRETKQKEIYLYKFNKTDGFGIQIIYDETNEDSYIIKNNSEILIEKGYHPVVSSPHSKMYYFWALFGNNNKFLVNFDKRYKE